MPTKPEDPKTGKKSFHTFPDPITEKYGIRQGTDEGAEFSPGSEETEEQEYMYDGLPSSTRYAVDKITGRPFIVKPRKNSSDSGVSH